MKYLEFLILMLAMLTMALWLMRARKSGKKCSFALPGLAAALAVLVLLALMGPTHRAYGQAYYTNSNYTAGPYQYNSSYVPAYNASAVITNQIANGIDTATILPGAGGVGIGTVVSNNFYVYYSQPPSVSVSDTLTGTNATTWIVSVTRSNVVVGCSSTNATFYLTAIGH